MRGVLRPRRSATAHYRPDVLIGLGELVVLLVLLGLVGFGGWALWNYLRRDGVGSGQAALPVRERAWLADSIAAARWSPGHDEIDGQTRILLRRSYTGLDGHPAVLEERVLETFAAQDPSWEARFTEAMSRARFRCAYLNGEESAG
jgi:hypothetical protein